MKIGTITYHRAINYGAVLQTYALQQVLETLKVDNEVIDYRANHIEKIYNPLSLRKVNSVKTFFSWLKDIPAKQIKRKKFLKFVKNNIKLSKKCTRSKLKKFNAEYDSFLTGSDQVFNLRCSNYDESYFLDFVNDENKKNSYSASFGFSEVPKEHRKKYKKLLKTFNNISVREEQGAKIVKELIDKEAVQTLDPTLLLSIHDWKKIIKKAKDKKDKYILIYAMKSSETLLKFAKELQDSTGLKMIFIKDSLLQQDTKKILGNKVKYLKNISPSEFVELFMNAEYIITNSFHGTAFSINFNKKFFTELLAPETKVNSRLENILDMLDLRSRQLVTLDSLTLDEVDYEKVNKILAERRSKSIDYLKNILAK